MLSKDPVRSGLPTASPSAIVSGFVNPGAASHSDNAPVTADRLGATTPPTDRDDLVTPVLVDYRRRGLTSSASGSLGITAVIPSNRCSQILPTITIRTY